ncbi:MAG: hypothetical protein ACRDO8_11875 [Nocardioidaceae bacterium]
MHPEMATQLARQRAEQILRASTGGPHGPDREPFRRRTARRLHRIARAIDITDL